MENIQDTQSGKTSQALSPPTKEKISDASSKASAKSATKPYLFLRLISGFLPGRSWETVTQLHGECSTRNTGEHPNEENASTLSQILQAGVRKYSLSRKACLGIRGELRVARTAENPEKGTGQAENERLVLCDQGGNLRMC